MNGLVKRDRRTFADVVDWLESEFPGVPAFRPFAGLQMVRVEELKDGNDYVVRAELPGVDPEKDVDVQLLDGVLTIKAERREENKDANRSEFRYGSFSRSLTLPSGVDENNVTASYKDGILEIRVPMREEQANEPRHIAVAKE
jgi:HSP20 family molecular chaperone IbpA